MTTNILLAAALWLVASVCSVAAIVFPFLGKTRHLRVPGLLGLTGAVIGGMGFSSWSPFGYPMHDVLQWAFKHVYTDCHDPAIDTVFKVLDWDEGRGKNV